MDFLDNYFQLKKHNTDIKTEILAGCVTFVSMAYIIIVNPSILKDAGMPFGASMTATILSAVFGTLLMGLYAKRPFAIAPYMGENAFITYTVVGVLGYSWQTALGAIFIGGMLFTILTIIGIREIMVKAIPESLKYSFSVGIGLFISFIGLVKANIVKLGVEGAPLHVGNFNNINVIIAIFGFILIWILMINKIKAALFIGIIITSLLAIYSGISKLPDTIFSMPPDISPIFLKMDILGAISWGFISVILTVFIMDFLDTIATLIGTADRAGFLDEHGNLPEIEKPMLVDSLATIFGAIVGTTTTGTFIESATGIEEGGRTGLTAVVVAILFSITLFFSPIVSAIPDVAIAPVLIIVGFLMVKPIKKIDFDDLTEMIPAFTVIIMMSFTYNIGIGLCSGFVLYPLFKVFTGRYKEVHPTLWVLFVLSLMFFIVYPY